MLDQAAWVVILRKLHLSHAAVTGPIRTLESHAIICSQCRSFLAAPARSPSLSAMHSPTLQNTRKGSRNSNTVATLVCRSNRHSRKSKQHASIASCHTVGTKASKMDCHRPQVRRSHLFISIQHHLCQQPCLCCCKETTATTLHAVPWPGHARSAAARTTFVAEHGRL